MGARFLGSYMGTLEGRVLLMTDLVCIRAARRDLLLLK